MISRVLHCSALGALIVLGAPTAAYAQRTDSAFNRFDVGFGATIGGPADVNQPPKCTDLGLPCETPRTMPDWGVVVQGAIRANPYTAVVVEGSIYDNNWVDVSGAAVNHVAALMAGPRLATSTLTFATRKDTTRYRVFAQLLAGREASTVLPTRFAVQPGVGLDGKLRWTPAWVRVAYDYRYTRGSPRNLSGSRVLLAVVVDPGGNS